MFCYLCSHDRKVDYFSCSSAFSCLQNLCVSNSLSRFFSLCVPENKLYLNATQGREYKCRNNTTMKMSPEVQKVIETNIGLMIRNYTHGETIIAWPTKANKYKRLLIFHLCAVSPQYMKNLEHLQLPLFCSFTCFVQI